MTKTSILFLAIAILGALLLLAYRVIGASVDEAGFLQEPFALLPIGFLLLVVGLVGGAVSLLIANRR